MDEWNRNREIGMDLCKYALLIVDKVSRAITRGMIAFSETSAGEIEHP